jgi:large conductance mechanosensitive channel
MIAATARTPAPAKGEIVKDFREFLLRGNLVEIAVGIVIGVAFTTVVMALVGDLITPLIAAIGGQPDFAGLHFTIHHSLFAYGAFLNALISFVVIVAVLFYFVVKPLNVLMARFKSEPPVDTTVRPCPECLSAIPAEARRCAFCTAQVDPAQAAPAL